MDFFACNDGGLFSSGLRFASNSSGKSGFRAALATIKNACFSPHAGAPSHKNAAASKTTSKSAPTGVAEGAAATTPVSLDCAIKSTGVDGATVTAAADDDDDDGDGGDPDSDRALQFPQKTRYRRTLPPALKHKRTTTSDRIVRMAEVAAITGLSRSTIYEYKKKGHFPQSVRLGPRAVGWWHSTLIAWLLSLNNATKA